MWCQYLDVPPISWEAHVTLEYKCNNPVLDKTVWLSLRESCSTEPQLCCCLFECQRCPNSYTIIKRIDDVILYLIKSNSHVLLQQFMNTWLKATIYTFPMFPPPKKTRPPTTTTAPGPAICRAPSPRMPSLPTPWPWWWQMNSTCVSTYLMNVVEQKYERNNTSVTLWTHMIYVYM